MLAVSYTLYEVQSWDGRVSLHKRTCDARCSAIEAPLTSMEMVNTPIEILRMSPLGDTERACRES